MVWLPLVCGWGSNLGSGCEYLRKDTERKVVGQGCKAKLQEAERGGKQKVWLEKEEHGEHPGTYRSPSGRVSQGGHVQKGQ